MGRKKIMKGKVGRTVSATTGSKSRLVATVKLNREPQRLYYVQGTTVRSVPRKGVPGAKRDEVNILDFNPNFQPRADCLYYLKGNQVMEAPFARR